MSFRLHGLNEIEYRPYDQRKAAECGTDDIQYHEDLSPRRYLYFSGTLFTVFCHSILCSIANLVASLAPIHIVTDLRLLHPSVHLLWSPVLGVANDILGRDVIHSLLADDDASAVAVAVPGYGDVRVNIEGGASFRVLSPSEGR